jgi:hypothetical protein
MDGLDDVVALDSLQIDRCDTQVVQVLAPELALDNDQRDSRLRHLDGVRVTELMRRGPPALAPIKAPPGTRVVSNPYDR